MCVLLVHHRVRADAPVVLLANRDEDYDRTFDPPSRWPGAAGIVAPRDKRANGTWIGTNAAGLVVAITNRPSEGPPRRLRSRGLLVADVLAHPDAGRAARWLDAHFRMHSYDAFNLLVLDRTSGVVVHHDDDGPRTLPVTPGTHMLTNFHEWDVAPVPGEGAPRKGETIDALLARLSPGGDRDALPGDHICKVGNAGTVSRWMLGPGQARACSSRGPAPRRRSRTSSRDVARGGRRPGRKTSAAALGRRPSAGPVRRPRTRRAPRRSGEPTRRPALPHQGRIPKRRRSRVRLARGGRGRERHGRRGRARAPVLVRMPPFIGRVRGG
jgi:hypothetical protein